MVVDPRKVQDLIVSYGNNYAQAIKAVQSKYKKDMKSGNPFLQLALAELFSRLRDFDNAETHLQHFLESRDILTDPDTLEKLYNMIAMTNKRKGNFTKSVGIDVIKVFETAAKKQRPTHGTDDPFVLLFGIAAGHHNWKDVQTACRFLRQRYPKDSNYFFLFIASCVLAAESSPQEERFFKLAMQKTAYTMLSKAAGNTLAAVDTPEKLTNLRHFHLLVQVYQRLGHNSELFAILEKGNDLRESIPDIKTDELRTLEVEVLALLKDQKVFNLCFAILNDAIECITNPTSDERIRMAASNQLQDWNLWKKMADSMERMEDGSTYKESERRFEQLVEKVECLGTKRFYEIRSAMLARLWAATKPAWSSKSLYELAVQYFEKSNSEPTCFTDLRPILPHLSSAEIESYLVNIQEYVASGISEGSLRDPFTASVNQARFQYLLKISAAETQHVEEIKNYLRKCLELIRSGIDGANDVGEVCLLAAVGCLHLAFLEKREEPDTEYLVYAAYLLNWLGTDMEYPAGQLLSVKMHLYLCLNSVAHISYHNLKIKNIVVDSFGYHMYSRSSLQFPSGTGGRIKEYASTAEELSDTLLRTYTDNVSGEWKKNPVRRWTKGLPQSDALLDIADQESELDKSLTRVILRVESRRCHRITGSKYEDVDPPIDKIADLHDGISYPPGWCLGLKGREYQFFDFIQDGPRIGKYWLAAFILVDDTCCMIWGLPSMVSDTSELELILSMEDATSCLKSETTEAELKVLEGWKLLRVCAKKILDRTVDLAAFKDDFADMIKWFTENIPLEKNASKLFGKTMPHFQVLPSTHLLQILHLAGEIIWAGMQLFLIRLPSALREHEMRLKKYVDLKMASSTAVQLMQAMLNISDILTSMRDTIERDTKRGIMASMEKDLGKEIMCALGEKDALPVAEKYYVSVRDAVDECLKINATQRRWIWASTSGQTLLTPLWEGKK